MLTKVSGCKINLRLSRVVFLCNHADTCLPAYSHKYNICPNDWPARCDAYEKLYIKLTCFIQSWHILHIQCYSERAIVMFRFHPLASNGLDKSNELVQTKVNMEIHLSGLDMCQNQLNRKDTLDWHKDSVSRAVTLKERLSGSVETERLICK